MKHSLVGATVLYTLGVLVACSQSAEAQTDPPPHGVAPLEQALSGAAKQAYEAATILLDNQDWQGAITKYRQAYELSKDPRLLFDMAVCERGLHTYAHMRALLIRYEQEAGTDASPEQKTDVDAALAAIANLVGTVKLTVRQAGASVAVDGEPVGSTPLTAPLVLDLGTHVLSVKKALFEPFERTLEIAGGNESTVSVALVEQVPPSFLTVVADPLGHVIIDQREVARGRYDGALPAGRHDVRVIAPGKAAYDARVELREGEKRTLLVTLADEPRAALWPWIVGGAVLAAGAVVGGYFIFQAHEESPSVPPATLGTILIPSGATGR